MTASQKIQFDDLTCKIHFHDTMMKASPWSEPSPFSYHMTQKHHYKRLLRDLQRSIT